MAVGEEEAQKPEMKWQEKVEEQWKKIREHAETYPYVWGSYILVYGGFAAYVAYRWRKLRKTENRVRILQERLRKLVESEESATSNGSGSGSGEKTGEKLPK